MDGLTHIGDRAVRAALQMARDAMRAKEAQIATANMIIAEQNGVIARAHDALRHAFDNMTVAENVVGLKKIAAVLAEIERRRA